MCKQLKGSVLKPLKPKRSGPKSGQNFEICFGFGLKFQFLFLAAPGPKLLYSLQTGRTEIITSRMAGLEKSSPCRPLPCRQVINAIHVIFCCLHVFVRVKNVC